jgi:Zn-dependent peptidase ImmA (M78 family)
VKRGFKAHAERISEEIRSELQLHEDSRLEPLELAEYLSIPVFSLKDVAEATPKSKFSDYFAIDEPDAFSAVTIFRGYQRVIVHNENHHPHRQASNLAHEVSHLLLEHEPNPIPPINGQRCWDAQVEEEASWLGAALLVPREGALLMAKSDWTVEEIAGHFGVSESLCRWRIAQSGIAFQVQRWRTRIHLKTAISVRR